MKPFTKSELIGLFLISLVLIAVSAPNFVASIRRARDQVRRDDMGAIQTGLSEYINDFGSFPVGSPNGRIMACKDPGDKVEVDAKGRLIVNLIPCEWGRDSILDLTPDSRKVYLDKIPGDPDTKKGVNYVYFSDGKRYQIFSSFEVEGQAEIDPRITARNISCGERICNVGRSYGSPIDKSIEEYVQEINQ